MNMQLCPLYSGSSGNALFVQYGETRVLVDAGKSGKMITDALRFIGVDPASINAILITHEHSDQIAGAGILARKLKVPVYATRGTWAAMAGKIGPVPEDFRREIESDSDLLIGKLGITSFPIPHDASEPVGYRFWGGSVSAATVTDLGYFTDTVMSAVRGTDLVLLESNHDPDMLKANDHYSQALKRRILGNHGHLSNEACAEAAVRLADTGVRNLILGHLSGENNTPRLALTTTETRCELEGIRLGEDLCIDIAYRDRVGGVYTLTPRDPWAE